MAIFRVHEDRPLGSFRASLFVPLQVEWRVVETFLSSAIPSKICLSSSMWMSRHLVTSQGCSGDEVGYWWSMLEWNCKESKLGKLSNAPEEMMEPPGAYLRTVSTFFRSLLFFLYSLLFLPLLSLDFLPDFFITFFSLVYLFVFSFFRLSFSFCLHSVCHR
jgi:hypothetical protein